MVIIVGVYFLGVLSVCGGIHTRLLRTAREDIAEAPDCVHAILQCSFAYTPLTTDQFSGTFFEREQELDQACRLNKNFIECIENAEDFCKARGIEIVESVMIENRLWARDLCAKNSDWKNLYMKYGRCINNEFSLVTEHCNLRIPVPPSDTEMENMCTYLDELTECKANLLGNRCGDNAAKIFRRITLLNGGREYLCSKHKNKQVEASPVLLAAQMLSNVKSLMKNLSDIFRESMGTEFLEEIDLTDPNLENPFEIDMKEFVRMMKGEFREDASDILVDSEHETEQPPLDVDDDMLNEETEKSEELFENIMEIPKKYTYSVFADVTDNPNDDQLENGADTQTEMKESTVDQPSCKIFDGIEIPSKNNASLNLYEISDLGHKNLLGSGLALVQWKTFQNTPLDDLFCSWMHQGSSSRLFRCALKLTELKTAQEPKPSIPVTLSLYTAMDNAEQSEEITLSKLTNICLENYEPSEDMSIETEEGYESKSILKEYMHNHDIHRSGQLWNEEIYNENEGNPSKPSELTNEEIFATNDDHEIIYKDSIELNAKEFFEAEDEVGVIVDSNFGQTSTEHQEIIAKSNNAEDKFSYYDDKDNLNNGHLYNEILEQESFEGFPEFVSSDYVSSDPLTCQSKRNSDCPKSDSKDGSPELINERFRHVVYTDPEHIEMVDPIKGSAMQENDNPSIAKLKVSDIDDFTHSDANTLDQSEAKKIIEDVIDNIFAEQI